MRIIALTDVHGQLNYFDAIGDELKEADVALLPGDRTMFGREKEARQVVDAVRNYNENVLAVMGNCDHEEVEAFLVAEDLCLHRTHRTVNGVTFVGLGGSLPCPSPTLNEWSEETIERYLNEAAEGIPEDTTVVLVSHQPAANRSGNSSKRNVPPYASRVIFTRRPRSTNSGRPSLSIPVRS